VNEDMKELLSDFIGVLLQFGLYLDDKCRANGREETGLEILNYPTEFKTDTR
jgi:hypothetical protein